MDFGKALEYAGWLERSGWMGSESVCKWHGVSCDQETGRVTKLSLSKNRLRGRLPETLGNISELTELRLEGSRPPSYHGCVDTDLGKTPLPEGFYRLSKLRDLNLEYTCLGGSLADDFGSFPHMLSLQLHGNFLTGKIPQSIDKMSKLEVFKLGRNPLSGGFPDMRKLTKLVQFNCNFCSLTGHVLDIFDHFPQLEVTYWDGNGFTGPLPSTVGGLMKLRRLSFNINNFSGPVPPSWAGLALRGVLTDCRIGSDTNLTSYLANYDWIQPVSGNVYSCPLPSFAKQGGLCEHVDHCSDVVAPCSPVICN